MASIAATNAPRVIPGAANLKFGVIVVEHQVVDVDRYKVMCTAL